MLGLFTLGYKLMNILSGRFCKTLLIITVILTGVFFAHSSADAALVSCGRLQDDPATTNINETKQCTVCDTLVLGSNIINFMLFTVVPAIAVLLYLIAGFLILLGGANPGWVSAGTNIFKTTTWGLIIVFGSWMITNSVLKSIAGNYFDEQPDPWNKVVCVGPVGPLPPVNPPPVNPPPPTGQKYSCNENNQCVANANGQHSNSTCDNKCQAVSSGPFAITPESLPDAIAGALLTYRVGGTGGIRPYVFYLSDRSPELAGINVNTSGFVGAIRAPLVPSTYFIAILAYDSSTPEPQKVIKKYTIKVVAAADAAVISNVVITNVTNTGATITWTTDKPSTSQAEYAIAGSPSGTPTTINSTLTTTHRVVISGLRPGTDYVVRAKSRITGFTAVSSNYNFKTTGSVTTACPLEPLTPITDPAALAMEGGQTIVWTSSNVDVQRNLTKLQAEFNKLKSLIPTAVVNSAYRPLSYQAHLYEIFQDAQQVNSDPSISSNASCNVTLQQLTAEEIKHGVCSRSSPCLASAPSGCSSHTKGTGIDIGGISDYNNVNSILQQNSVDLRWQGLTDDRVHFNLQNPPFTGCAP